MTELTARTVARPSIRFLLADDWAPVTFYHHSGLPAKEDVADVLCWGFCFALLLPLPPLPHMFVPHLFVPSFVTSTAVSTVMWQRLCVLLTRPTTPDFIVNQVLRVLSGIQHRKQFVWLGQVKRAPTISAFWSLKLYILHPCRTWYICHMQNWMIVLPMVSVVGY